MNPADFLFTFLGTLTGGLITDMQTLLLGFVAIGFLNFGAQILIGKLESAAVHRKAVSTFNMAQDFRALRNSSRKGSIEYEYYNAMYRSKFSSAVGISAKHNISIISPLEQIDKVSEHDLIEEIGDDDFLEEIGQRDLVEESDWYGEECLMADDVHDVAVYRGPISSPRIGYSSVSHGFDAHDSGPAYYSDDPGPSEYYGPSDDDYYGPY